MQQVLCAMVCLSLSAAACAQEQALHVQFMSFNIRYGTAHDGPNHWRHRKDMVIDVIDRQGGDFVGLQEALKFQIDVIVDALPRYAYSGVGRDDGKRAGEYSCILYDTTRWALDPQEHGTFWLSDTPDEPGSNTWGTQVTRIVSWGRFIEHETKQGIYVFNTHFDNRSQPAREKSARLLAERVAGRSRLHEPVVVMGDLNAGEDNPVIAYLRGEAAESPVSLVDTFRVVHPDEQVVGTSNRFELGRVDGPKIDYILVEPHATVKGAAILRDHREGRYPSDHFPITAEVVWRRVACSCAA